MTRQAILKALISHELAFLMENPDQLEAVVQWLMELPSQTDSELQKTHWLFFNGE
jgi:hypothetical protein